MARTIDDAEAEQQVTAAVLYYEQHRSQKEIALRLGVSRPTVSRLLARAREQGIVRIEIVPPRVDPAQADRLRERLGLRAVFVAPGRADEADPGPLLAEPLGRALDEAGLAAGDVLLVSWGRAVYSLGQHVRRSLPGIVVAPAMGGNDGDRRWFQPNEIARIWAASLGGQARYLHAPALVSPTLYDSLQADRAIRETIGLWDRAKMLVVGVGAWPKPDISYAAAGFPVDDPALADAAGDIMGWSFTIDGTLVPHRDPRRLLGISPEQIRRLPYVVCFAASPSKARAAIGVARAGLINVLVTDAATSRAIETHLDAEDDDDAASLARAPVREATH